MKNVLENVDLKVEIKKKESKLLIENLQNDLMVLQQQMKELKIPMLILFEGWDGSGKGVCINKLVNQLDTRAYTVYSIQPADEAEKRKPVMWRYWQKVPVYGKISIFDESWYQEIAWAEFEEEDFEENRIERYEQIKAFERQLADDGYVLVKLFLHISQEEQKKRQDEQLHDRATTWQVTRRDQKQNRNYEKFFKIFDSMIQRTHTEYAPWYLISAEDDYYGKVQFMRIIRDVMQKAIDQKRQGQHRIDWVVPNRFDLMPIPRLNEVNLEISLSDEAYKEEKGDAGKRLAELHNYLYQKKIPLIVLYEGWDASGKGGNIRRLTQSLDPRGYRVIPTVAPDYVEKNHHYLWRFWRDLPKTGHIAIFDRTWYGRVMVERVENLCREDEWKRAYREINEFEATLDDWGAIIVKFWIQIDQEEQLRRFNDRQNNPDKQWKITEEDWRNREKWPLYEEAINEMLQKTHTNYAPWTIIEGNDKKYARVKAMRTIIKAIEQRMD